MPGVILLIGARRKPPEVPQLSATQPSLRVDSSLQQLLAEALSLVEKAFGIAYTVQCISNRCKPEPLAFAHSS